MTTPREYLPIHAESTPEWLMHHRAGDPFPRNDFFASRTVFYPACGRDGHPLRTFGGSRSAGCFVFVDRSTHVTDVVDKLEDHAHHRHPRGYVTVETRQLVESELRPGGWRRHVTLERRHHALRAGAENTEPFAVWSVLERDPSLDDRHGAKRIAILFVGGEGNATFDALYCQGDARPPFAILLQDHTYMFGGQPARFGGDDSILYRLASEHNALPEWLLAADNTRNWPNYERVSDSENGGWYHQPRSLWRRCTQENPA